MKPGDRVVLELTHDQAKIVERAVELLFRLHIGQFNEIKFALLNRRDERNTNSWQDIDMLLGILQNHFFPRLAPGESFNVNCCEECNIAYSIYQAVRYVNAWHMNPEGGIGVSYDPPMYTGVPIPKCYLVKEGEEHKAD